MNAGPVTKTDSDLPGGIAMGGLLVVATIVCYLPAMGSGFIWDDDAYVDWQTTHGGAGGLQKIWFEPGATMQYYPVTYSAFWIQRQLWELDPFGYHLVNVLLHAASVLLLWRLLKRLGAGWAFAAAMVFAIHPVCVESVAWVSELKNTLSGFFYLLAGLAYLRFSPPDQAGPSASRWRWCAAAVAMFLLAVLTKTVTASWPAAVLLVLWWKRGKINWRDVAVMAPLFMIGAAAGAMTAWLEVYHAGAAGSDWDLGWGERFILAGRALWFYVGKIVWPAELAFVYPRWNLDAADWTQWLWTILAIFVIAALWMLRRKIGRGPITAALFFAGTLFPALGFLNVYPFRFSFVADHFQYLASIGLIVLVVSTIRQLHAISQGIGRRIILVCGAAVIVCLCVLTFLHCRIFQNPKTLWEDTVAKNNRCWLAYAGLGDIAMNEGNHDLAIRQYSKSLAFYPNQPKVVYNLAMEYMKMDKFDLSEKEFTRLVAMEPDNAKIRMNFGVLLVRLGRLDEAIANLRRASEIQPQSADIRINLGRVYIEAGRFKQAVEQLKQAVAIQPNTEAGWYFLGLAFEKLGDMPGAAACYERCLKINPSNKSVIEAMQKMRGVAASRTAPLAEPPPAK